MSDCPSKTEFELGEEEEAFSPPKHIRERAHCSSWQDYCEMYDRSIKDPVGFWSEMAKHLYFEKPWDDGRFLEYNFDIRNGPVFVQWMSGAKSNVCYNALDRHVKNGHGDRVAFYWEGNDPADTEQLTYKELLDEVCRFANVLKSKNVKKGDRVAIYLPVILQLPIVMLACARLGVVHSVVFGGYSAAALAQRITDAKADVLVTADGAWRGSKLINLKKIADHALIICNNQGHQVKCRIIIKHLKNSSSLLNLETNIGKNCDTADFMYADEMKNASINCPVEWMESEEPLFILYTSGSTGKPKGVVHTQLGYLLYAYTTFRYVFDYHEGDVHFCTADLGWITGHSYVLYGPLANGCTCVLFEGIPTHPNPDRYWQIIDKYKVTKFYTAPTAIRHLMRYGEKWVNMHSLESLQILGSVGETFNPEAWLWYYNVVGRGRCSVVDTYWQTETGGHMITPLPGCTDMKAGAVAFPFFGVQAALFSDDGKEITGEGEGYLVVKAPWPGMLRTLYGNQRAFEDVYFTTFPGCFTFGDGGRRDKDGYLWITGRVDDMMNVSGHLVSSAEIESAVVAHLGVAEAAVVAAPHSVKGQIPYCFVILKNGFQFTDELVREIKNEVRNRIGPVATPEVFQRAEGLPKTRSGKILRRVLRKIAVGETEHFGDLSTLAEEHVIHDLIHDRNNLKFN